MVARTACTWIASDCSTVVQLVNTDTHGLEFPQGTGVRHIMSANPIPTHSVSATITVDDQSQACSELEPVLLKSFENTTLDTDQRAQILYLCTKYRKAFSLLNSQELGTCTTM